MLEEKEGMRTPISLLEACDDARVRLKNTFAQVRDVVDGLIVQLQAR